MVVERLMVKFSLEGATLGHVPAVRDDGADVGVVQQVGQNGLELPPAAIDVA